MFYSSTLPEMQWPFWEKNHNPITLNTVTNIDNVFLIVTELYTWDGVELFTSFIINILMEKLVMVSVNIYLPKSWQFVILLYIYLTQKEGDNMREKQNRKLKLKVMYPFKCVTVFNPVTLIFLEEYREDN